MGAAALERGHSYIFLRPERCPAVPDSAQKQAWPEEDGGCCRWRFHLLLSAPPTAE